MDLLSARIVIACAIVRVLLYFAIFLTLACTNDADTTRPNGTPDGGETVADASGACLVDSALADHVVQACYTEKRCGETAETLTGLYSTEDIARFAGCTTLVGRFQEDSVSALEDFSGLESVRNIEGTLNVFRSPGFRTLRGLDNLEIVQGNLFIHLNPNLTSIAALAKLHTVTGNLFVANNDVLPQSELDALGARVQVGGEKTLKSVR